MPTQDNKLGVFLTITVVGWPICKVTTSNSGPRVHASSDSAPFFQPNSIWTKSSQLVKLLATILQIVSRRTKSSHMNKYKDR